MTGMVFIFLLLLKSVEPKATAQSSTKPRRELFVSDDTSNNKMVGVFVKEI
jgi:hypothetical protein